MDRVLCCSVKNLLYLPSSYGIFGNTPTPNLVAALTALETTRRRFPTMPPNEKHSSLQNFTPRITLRAYYTLDVFDYQVLIMQLAK